MFYTLNRSITVCDWKSDPTNLYQSNKVIRHQREIIANCSRQLHNGSQNVNACQFGFVNKKQIGKNAAKLQ